MRLYGICLVIKDPAPTEVYTLSLHGALPIYPGRRSIARGCVPASCREAASSESQPRAADGPAALLAAVDADSERLGMAERRSEEHTTELQSRQYLVCRLLLEKNNRTGVDKMN